MCGIVGYVGQAEEATGFVLEGLQALEYRGYDSAGLTTLLDGQPRTVRQVGRVENLEQQLSREGISGGRIAIGHTRWATHGRPSVQNAHPHSNQAQTIFVVHNGIIENYRQLKTRLQKLGYNFVSTTDTEVIPHLIDYYLTSQKTFLAAFKTALRDLEGAYAIAAVSQLAPGSIYVARLSSPLVIGVGEQQYFIASDAAALFVKTKKAIYLDDYNVAHIRFNRLEVSSISHSRRVQHATQDLDAGGHRAMLGKFPHYMLKEIHEGPQTIRTAQRGRIKVGLASVKLGGLDSVAEQLRYIDRIVIVACGTSYYAGLVGEYLIEELAGIPVEVQLASEFKYRSEPFSRGTALLAISQSGETADTIAAIKKTENYGVLRLGIVNVVGSTIARMTEAGVYCHAGPEQSVASTKAFMAQVTVLSEIALSLSGGKTPLYKPLIAELDALPRKARAVLAGAKAIKAVAQRYSTFQNFLFVGRNYLYPCALEGALKLKEVSYLHAEGYAAGETKHGPLAMIDSNFPTMALACDSRLLAKTLSNIEEIKARGGPVLAIATKGNQRVAELADDVLYIPPTLEALQPLLVMPVLQLFAYYVATHKGLDVDRPRNLAKSVTVE